MQEPQRHYWAFCANPKIYKIEQAVQKLSEDSWTVPRGNVRVGDRAIIWKAKGNDWHRGIIALAEVLTNPKPSIAPDPDYWVDQNAANEVVDRVMVHTISHWSCPSGKMKQICNF